ncbi:MAG: aminotransferase class I/II-fold pyridoxal phosphate-dependent enzyme [Candidatus Heimdallarchaeota archaeon]|nr:aminotransferase class I/II-fold pyridoxal phosphate-dependent enzyme [Candidatus Heimdallarchaeota archaeon]
MQENKKSKEEIQNEIFKLIDKYFQIVEENETEKIFPLVVPPYDAEEVKEALESLLSTYVTMGKKCYQFEADFAKYIGVKHGLFVNSGSSANLIALSILSSPAIENPIQPGDEIITSAVTWSTTVFPILDIGAIPVFVDSDPETMTMDVSQIENAITKKTRAIMPVHLLGNPCDMEKIMEIAKKHKLFVIEDSCEAHGAMIGNKMVGSFGHLSTFSFFFSHHISTIEGGIVLTDNPLFMKIGQSLRAHGWIRERSDKDEIAKEFPEIDSRFLFVHRGYNFRPTEIQGAFGIHQLPKLEKFIEARIEAAYFLIKNLKKYEQYLILPKIFENARQSWFGFAILVKENAPFTNKELSNYLEENSIETRQIMGGNFVEQPIMDILPHRTINELPKSQFIFHNGIFIGLHNKLDIDRLNKVVMAFDEFFANIKE